MKRYLSWIVLLVAAAVFVSTHLMWMQSLPERVATHFNAVGQVNGWMSRSTHSTFMLLFGLGLPCFIMVLMWVMRFLPPNLMNVPKAAYWRSPEHYPAAMQFMQEWSRWFAAANCFGSRCSTIKSSSPIRPNRRIWRPRQRFGSQASS